MTFRRLDFVIAGAQKSGTTSLDRLLRGHPRIQMSRVKETHVFDDERRDWSAPEAIDLSGYFPAADDRLCGEATPITLYWRPAIRRLRRHAPDLKIVLLLRDPVERAYAGWCKEFAARLETLPFADAIRAGRARVGDEAETEGLHRVFSYVERGFYGAQLGYLLEHFPRAAVHCETFEALVAEPRAALDRLTAFLGVAPFAPEARPPHLHRRKDVAYPSPLTEDDAAFLADLYRDDVAALEAMLRRPLPDWRPSAAWAARGRSAPDG